ncbi:hypothetical protein ABEB36_015338 [Hypothenemus hampei]|uniref:Uncharacterized protein n=1 Tax=Hypothenemus hampei TaxID=57062 RepID=A0ABD1DZW9_HYPHA
MVWGPNRRRKTLFLDRIATSSVCGARDCMITARQDGGIPLFCRASLTTLQPPGNTLCSVDRKGVDGYGVWIRQPRDISGAFMIYLGRKEVHCWGAPLLGNDFELPFCFGCWSSGLIVSFIIILGANERGVHPYVPFFTKLPQLSSYLRQSWVSYAAHFIYTSNGGGIVDFQKY